MLAKPGSRDSDADRAAELGDARSAALTLMSEALARLDSDCKIPASIGAHLQSAIDALWMSTSGQQPSTHLH